MNKQNFCPQRAHHLVEETRGRKQFDGCYNWDDRVIYWCETSLIVKRSTISNYAAMTGVNRDRPQLSSLNGHPSSNGVFHSFI